MKIPLTLLLVLAVFSQLSCSTPRQCKLLIFTLTDKCIEESIRCLNNREREITKISVQVSIDEDEPVETILEIDDHRKIARLTDAFKTVTITAESLCAPDTRLAIHYKGNKCVYIEICADPDEKIVYGADFHSKELYGVLDELGLVKEPKISPMPSGRFPGKAPLRSTK